MRHLARESFNAFWAPGPIREVNYPMRLQLGERLQIRRLEHSLVLKPVRPQCVLGLCFTNALLPCRCRMVTSRNFGREQWTCVRFRLGVHRGMLSAKTSPKLNIFQLRDISLHLSHTRIQFALWSFLFIAFHLKKKENCCYIIYFLL